MRRRSIRRFAASCTEKVLRLGGGSGLLRRRSRLPNGVDAVVVKDLLRPAVVAAAQAGDRRALDEIVAAYLPLVYSIVRRAAEPDLDVDDIVQDTMIRLVGGIGSVREPDRLRSWVVTIAIRQLAAARQVAGRERMRRGVVLPDRPDASVDVEQTVMTRHLLFGEQRELAKAMDWLDAAHRPVAALWWLELKGQLSRTELAEALGESVAHAGVRLQRMREQLALARSVVRILAQNPRCSGLGELVADWAGEPSPLWRKRLARHLRQCAACTTRTRELSSSDRLLAGLPLLLPAPDLTARIASTGSFPAGNGLSGLGQVTPAQAGSMGKTGFFGGTAGKVAAVAAAVAVIAGVFLSLTTQRPDARPRPNATAVLPGPVAPPRSQGALSASPRVAIVPSRAPSGKITTFRTGVPAFPASSRVTSAGSLRQNTRVEGRDNGQSAEYDGQSVWIFADTTLKNPFGFLSNSAAITTDVNASNGIDLRSGNGVTVRNNQTPVQLIPLTVAEKAYEKAHEGVRFGFWPGPVVADPQRHRVLFTYGKLCRGGADGMPCTGPLGKGLGMGIAAMDMRSGKVSRLKARGAEMVTSVEGRDPALFFGPDTAVGSAAALVVDGMAYLYGDCAYGCRLARVDLASIDDLSAWRYHRGGKWVPGRVDADHLIGQGGAGQTVFYSAGLKAYVNVFMPFGSNTVKYQVGGSPFGPWSKERDLFLTSGGEAKNYALFAHPEYAERNGLVQYLSYFDPQTGAQRLLRWEMTLRR